MRGSSPSNAMAPGARIRISGPSVARRARKRLTTSIPGAGWSDVFAVGEPTLILHYATPWARTRDVPPGGALRASCAKKSDACVPEGSS